MIIIPGEKVFVYMGDYCDPSQDSAEHHYVIDTGLP